MSFETVPHHKIPSAFLNFNGRLSEGSTYNPQNNTLLWVDIIAGKVHRVSLDSIPSPTPIELDEKTLESIKSTHQEFVIPNEKIGVIYLIEDNNDLIYVGAKYGFAQLDLKTGDFKYVAKYPAGDSHLRSNDGNVDPQGRSIYAGLMGDFDIGPVKDGKVYKFDLKTKQFDIVEKDVLIPNGLNFSYDKKSLYWTSSLEFIIYKFDYDVEENKVSNKKVFIDIKKAFPGFESPEPDGFAITRDNHIYTAVWGTGSVAHFNELGQLVEILEFPAQRISSVSIGGAESNEVFVTSANLHLDDVNRLNEEPEDLGGSLFRFKIDQAEVKGVSRPPIKANLV